MGAQGQHVPMQELSAHEAKCGSIPSSSQPRVHVVRAHAACATKQNVHLVETGAHPIVYGEWLRAAGQPTALIYGHYDVQPVDPLEAWRVPPFKPVRSAAAHHVHPSHYTNEGSAITEGAPRVCGRKCCARRRSSEQAPALRSPCRRVLLTIQLIMR